MYNRTKGFSTAFLVANWLIFMVIVSLILYQSGPSEQFEPPRHSNTERPTDPPKLAHGKTTQPLEIVTTKHQRVLLGRVDSRDYDVTEQPDCWARGCSEPNNKPARTGCSKRANAWLEFGVNEMVRLMNDYEDQGQALATSAIAAFKKALKADLTCSRAHENIGLALLYKNNATGALHFFKSSGSPKSIVFKGFALEMLDKKDEALQVYNLAAMSDPKLRREYHGVMLSSGNDPKREYQVMSYSKEIELPTILAQLLWKEFGEKSYADFGQLPVENVQKDFLRDRFIIIPRFIPPFVLKATQRCYKQLITRKILKLGDTQSLRYTAYNSRCMSFLHRSYADLVRKVVSHNAKPSYTYFGGYREGAELIPHTDRAQCEFTLSWTIENFPKGDPWPLGLDYNPEWTGRQDDYRGINGLKWPPKHRSRWAKLLAGDALLFMGRRHNHFREGKLKKGAYLNQVFMHYVPERFTKQLG